MRRDLGWGRPEGIYNLGKKSWKGDMKLQTQEKGHQVDWNTAGERR